MSKRTARNIYVLLYFVFCAILVGAVYFYTLQSGLDRLSETARVRIDQASDRLLGQLASYKLLPNILTRHPEIKSVFLDDYNLNDTDALLQRTALLSGSEQIYVVDRKGAVIAVSDIANFRSDASTLQQRRPYIQAALNGRLGSFTAIDETTGARTAFFARGVYTNAPTPVGAVVVEVDVAALEFEWHVDDAALAFFDVNDVAFITNRPSMALRRLATPNMPLADDRRYDQDQISDFFAHRKSQVFGWDIWTFNDTTELPAEALVMSQYIPRLEMTARIFLSTKQTKFSARVQAGLTAAILLALGLGLWSLWLRRQRLADRLAIEEAANAKLEARVEERTQQLKRTQHQLIQAGKLKALGEMSAGISHELNQPLAAIQNFAANGEKLLDRERLDDAKGNFGLIGEQIDRATRIIKSLRAFARKEKETIEPVDMQTVIDESLSLTNARFDAEQVTLNRQTGTQKVMVLGGRVRLQQVIINLLNNAIDAMTECETKQITIQMTQGAESVQISVRDTGVGLSDPERVFEPFYSTKDIGSSKGMGLGMSISFGIVGSFGGDMSCRNHPDGGAEFIVSLRTAETPEDT